MTGGKLNSGSSVELKCHISADPLWVRKGKERVQKQGKWLLFLQQGLRGQVRDEYQLIESRWTRRLILIFQLERQTGSTNNV